MRGVSLKRPKVKAQKGVRKNFLRVGGRSEWLKGTKGFAKRLRKIYERNSA